MENDREVLKKPYQQLQMVWPKNRLGSPPPISLPAVYELRTAGAGDEPGFFQVMELAGFKGWDESRLERSLANVLSEGWFLIIHASTGDVVATAMATRKSTEHHPLGGELGWVAGHPDHAGQGLGLAICAAVTRRLLNAGYQDIYLKTDDWRLAAIKTYLKLGYTPFLFASDMADRWQSICVQLNWPFTLDQWPKVPDERV